MVVGRINGVVALTGFSYEEMYGRFAGTKKSGRNNEVVVRRGSTVVNVMDLLLASPVVIQRICRIDLCTSLAI